MADPTGLITDEAGRARCWWSGNEAIYRDYHDLEWGRPVADDVRLFEKLSLEAFQCGLSWLTILKKREAFREAFRGFEPAKVARFTERDVERLLSNAGIVRHRGKIEATIRNARQALELIEERGSLAAFFWDLEPTPAERPARLDASTLRSLSTTPASSRLSKELKRRGFRFVGPTTAYALMQAMGIVNDHVEGCAVRPEIELLRDAFERPR